MAEIIKGDFSGKGDGQAPLLAKDLPCYQFHVALAFTDPLIWRRIQVPGKMTLAQLHDVLQVCMGWENYHMHQFLVGKIFYDSTADIHGNGEKKYDEAKYELHQLEEGMRFLFTYIYDFGDHWEHELHLEEVISPGKGQNYPLLLDGERACPPEDVGGPPGFDHFLEVMADCDHQEYRDMVNWYGKKVFAADFLDISRINDQLAAFTV